MPSFCTHCSVRCLHNKIHPLPLVLHSFKSFLFWALHQQSTTGQTNPHRTKHEPQDSLWPWGSAPVSAQFVFLCAQPLTLLLCSWKRGSSVPCGTTTAGRSVLNTIPARQPQLVTPDRCHRNATRLEPSTSQNSGLPSKKQHLTEQSYPFLDFPLTKVCFWGWSFQENQSGSESQQ